MLEARFGTEYFADPTDDPGLVLGRDGSVSVVRTDGTREPLPGAGGSGELVTASYSFAFNTPGITNGVSTGITLPAGALIRPSGIVISVPVPWGGGPVLDSSFPAIYLGTSQVMSQGQAQSFFFTNTIYVNEPGANTPAANETFANRIGLDVNTNNVPGASPWISPVGGATIWLSVDDGSAEDPPVPSGAASGAGKIWVSYLV